MAHIHFVNYERDMKRLDAETHRYESCCWVIGDEAREALSTGGRIYFHESQTSPSFFGGTIIGFRETGNEPGKPRRWAVEFIFEEQARNVVPDTGGWKRESKFVP